MSKTHRVRELEPGVWLYSDGAQRYADGRLAKQHPQAAPTITSESAPAMVKRRHELAKEHAAAGLLRAVQANEQGYHDTAPAAWGVVVEKQTELALAIDTGRDSTQAAKFVGQATGYVGQQEPAGGADRRTFVLNITEGSYDRLKQLAGDVIDVEPVGDWDTADGRSAGGDCMCPGDECECE